MSRAAADQLTTPWQEDIYATFVTQADGTKRSVMSSASLSDQSISANSSWKRAGEIWNGNEEYEPGKYRTTYTQQWCSNLGALYLLRLSAERDEILAKRGNGDTQALLCADVWQFAIGSFIFGADAELGQNLGGYAVAIRRPTLFSQIQMDPFTIVDAAMRGQEDMVLNILNADPSYLLRKAKVKNSVGIEYEVTPLEAAIMAMDVQMAERMKPHFERLAADLEGNPIDGVAEMQKQFKAIYTKSLKNYLQKQEMEIVRLLQLETMLEEDDKKLGQAEENIKIYSQALGSQDTTKIFEAHTQAEKDNAFDFKPYADAIWQLDITIPAQETELGTVMKLINAQTKAEIDAAIEETGVSFTQTDDARAKPFDQLTLVEKLNRFREELVKHMQSELIFNPNHIVNAWAINEEKYPDFSRAGTDRDYPKHTVIFSQLVGFAQRVASEPTKQDIRQGTLDIRQGTYFLTGGETSRMRQYRSFLTNYSLTSFSPTGFFLMDDVSLVDSSVINGLGFKFGSLSGFEYWRIPSGGGFILGGSAVEVLSELMSSKNIKLSELMQPMPIHTKQRWCVVS